MVTEKTAEKYKITSGKEMSDRNTEYPDRYLLLRHLGEDKYQVVDFGDFAPYRVSNLLNIFRSNEKYLDGISGSIFDFIQKINEWLDSTGSEFLIDAKMFRFGMKRKGRDQP
jgi:hypothetical protein